jgi:hypothetical protein
VSEQQQIEDFRAWYTKQAQAPTPRIMFTLDATASRQPTWDQAAALHAEMFKAAGSEIEVKLLYYRGDECKAGPWTRNQDTLLTLMRKITCVAGYTQIKRVLDTAVRETETGPVRALVFVADAFEESKRDMREPAAMLGQKGTPCFMFQEGGDWSTAKAFKEIAKLSGGLYASFDASASERLREQLKAILLHRSKNADRERAASVARRSRGGSDFRASVVSRPPGARQRGRVRGLVTRPIPWWSGEIR